jgi:ectoine hydroxylase-related dioxygenase (phytanoyl-CoA dioxygenase family)
MQFNPQVSLSEFKAQLPQATSASDYPGAAQIVRNIPLYDGASVTEACSAEWARILERGPGVFVIRGAYADTAIIDEASDVYFSIIEEERSSGRSAGDHFAAAGANDRVWNSLQKLCLRAPAIYARYIGNPLIAQVCRAWLGPGYQIATQLNVVRPGGTAQQPHRDYHLGFMSPDEMRAYPEHVHRLSPTLVLQGGVAHCDMPVESGTTKLLPYSQRYLPGYIAATQPEFREYFEENYVQLPLRKGDAVFFSPALFHAAGENRTPDVVRMVNLFQTTSAFAQSMETIDRAAMSKAIFPHLAALDPQSRAAAIAATAAGYSFPTNLDTDPPIGGLAPESQQGLLTRAVEEGWSAERLDEALAAQSAKRLS